jgi:hypothetical protein
MQYLCALASICGLKRLGPRSSALFEELFGIDFEELRYRLGYGTAWFKPTRTARAIGSNDVSTCGV